MAGALGRRDGPAGGADRGLTVIFAAQLPAGAPLMMVGALAALGIVIWLVAKMTTGSKKK